MPTPTEASPVPEALRGSSESKKSLLCEVFNKLKEEAFAYPDSPTVKVGNVVREKVHYTTTELSEFASPFK